MIWRNRNNPPRDEPEQPDESPEPESEAPEEPHEETVSEAPDAGNSPAAMSSVGERVESVLEAAERAAADIRRDAEQWAQQHMEKTRRHADELAAQRVQELSSITDDLLARAQALARHSDELVDAVDAARRRVLRGLPSAGDQEQANGAPGSTDPGPIPAGAASSPGIRLLARQMAIAGASKEKIEIRLKEEFGIEDPSAILDEAWL